MRRLLGCTLVLVLCCQSAPGQATLGPPIPVSETPRTVDVPTGFDWSKSKYRYQKMFWPAGSPGIPPTGTGYYSFRDWLIGDLREQAPKSGYGRAVSTPQGFGEANFSYLDTAKEAPSFFESLHRIHVHDNWIVGTGGEYRNRFNYEGNSRLTGTTNAYDLNRVRVFGDLYYQDRFRFFVEMLDSRSTAQSLTPGRSDRNYADLLNLFADIKLGMIGDEAVYARLGRQQMTLGSQRIISTSDWGFTGRTFEGVRLLRRSEKFDATAFWLRPVVPEHARFDSADPRQNFAGVYTTYRPTKDRFLDTYYLFLGNHNNAAIARQNSVGSLANNAPYEVHTLGFRYAGKNEHGFLWDFENMLQLGDGNRGEILAGNLTNGIGYQLKSLPWTPTVWGYLDYATGSDRVAGRNTFNQLFPLAHYYLGQIDYIGRANIQDVNFHLYLYPTKWITLNAQYHVFQLAQARDALYTTQAAVSRSDPTGRAGRDVGSEFDVSASFHVGPHVDILAVYTHFLPGNFLRATGPSDNTNTVYFVFNFRW